MTLSVYESIHENNMFVEFDDYIYECTLQTNKVLCVLVEPK